MLRAARCCTSVLERDDMESASGSSREEVQPEAFQRGSNDNEDQLFAGAKRPIQARQIECISLATVRCTVTMRKDSKIKEVQILSSRCAVRVCSLLARAISLSSG
jgi:hypothetical protein